MDKNISLKTTMALSLLMGATAMSSVAQAGPVLKVDDTKWISIGAGLRTSFASVEKAAPNGSDRSKDFSVESMRLYVNGQVHKDIKFTFNTEKDSSNGESVRVLDAIARFEFSESFNVWMGRLLPPSDRSNLDGPYYLNAWNFPIVQNYPAIFAGRDDGIAVWGHGVGGKLKYQGGAFQGRDGGSNTSDSLLYAGRLTFNLWDAEPGYYNSSAYYGTKDILAFGVVAMMQKDGAGTAVTQGDFTGWNLDALMEKKMVGGGVLSLEGAYYDYDLDNVADASLVQGDGYLLLAAYLLPQKMGIGQLQPHIRFQSFDSAGATDARTRMELGVNYIIDGHDARGTLTFANDDPGTPASSSVNSIQLGLQFQI